MNFSENIMRHLKIIEIACKIKNNIEFPVSEIEKLEETKPAQANLLWACYYLKREEYDMATRYLFQILNVRNKFLLKILKKIYKESSITFDFQDVFNFNLKKMIDYDTETKKRYMIPIDDIKNQLYLVTHNCMLEDEIQFIKDHGQEIGQELYSDDKFIVEKIKYLTACTQDKEFQEAAELLAICNPEIEEDPNNIFQNLTTFKYFFFFVERQSLEYNYDFLLSKLLHKNMQFKKTIYGSIIPLLQALVNDDTQKIRRYPYFYIDQLHLHEQLKMELQSLRENNNI